MGSIETAVAAATCAAATRRSFYQIYKSIALSKSPVRLRCWLSWRQRHTKHERAKSCAAALSVTVWLLCTHCLVCVCAHEMSFAIFLLLLLGVCTASFKMSHHSFKVLIIEHGAFYVGTLWRRQKMKGTIPLIILTFQPLLCNYGFPFIIHHMCSLAEQDLMYEWMREGGGGH